MYDPKTLPISTTIQPDSITISQQMAIVEASFLQGTIWQLNRLFVNESIRNQGVASRLMKALCDVVDKKSFLLLCKDNPYSTLNQVQQIAFYDKFGFTSMAGRKGIFVRVPAPLKNQFFPIAHQIHLDFTSDECYKEKHGNCSLEVEYDTASYKKQTGRRNDATYCQRLYLAMQANAVQETSVELLHYTCGHYDIHDGRHRVCIATKQGLSLDPNISEESRLCIDCNPPSRTFGPDDYTTFR